MYTDSLFQGKRGSGGRPAHSACAGEQRAGRDRGEAKVSTPRAHRSDTEEPQLDAKWTFSVNGVKSEEDDFLATAENCTQHVEAKNVGWGRNERMESPDRK